MRHAQKGADVNKLTNGRRCLLLLGTCLLWAGMGPGAKADVCRRELAANVLFCTKRQGRVQKRTFAGEAQGKETRLQWSG